jgi:sensor histidine kinase YesM
MILQPVVENALVHGIMNKPSNGLVQIRFYKTHNHIICSVEDDGIGREASLENKTQGKLSISTNNIIQRIQLINQGAQANKISYEIIDKHNPNNHACGTIFELKIPLNFQQK